MFNINKLHKFNQIFFYQRIAAIKVAPDIKIAASLAEVVILGLTLSATRVFEPILVLGLLVFSLYST